MKEFLQFFAACIAALVFLICTVPAQAADPKFVKFNGVPVSDQANILSDEKEAALNKQLIDFNQKTGRQIVVTTIASLEGREIEEYSNQYFRFLGVGSKELNDGVLFLIAPNDRRMRIEVGTGLEEYLTDAHSGRILDDIKPYFREKNYDGGIQYGVDNITPLITPEAMAFVAAEKKKEAIAAAKSREAFGNFFETLGIIVGSVGGLIGAFFVVTIPVRRKRKREEEARLAAIEKAAAEKREKDRAEAAERNRLWQIEENKRQIERRKEEDRLEKIRLAEEARKEAEWQEYLKNETSEQKKARLAEDERKRLAALEAAAIAAAAAEAARAAQVERDRQAAAQRAADEEARRARRRREEAEEDDRRSRSSYDSGSSWGSSSYGSSSSDSSSSSSFDFGGGSSSGGGASSDW